MVPILYTGSLDSGQECPRIRHVWSRGFGEIGFFFQILSNEDNKKKLLLDYNRIHNLV